MSDPFKDYWERKKGKAHFLNYGRLTPMERTYLKRAGLMAAYGGAPAKFCLNTTDPLGCTDFNCPACNPISPKATYTPTKAKCLTCGTEMKGALCMYCSQQAMNIALQETFAEYRSQINNDPVMPVDYVGEAAMSSCLLHTGEYGTNCDHCERDRIRAKKEIAESKAKLV